MVGAGTNYDQKAGNAASNFSFKGVGPGPYVEAVTSAASQKTEKELRQAHITDYRTLMGEFVLDLADTAGSTGLETSVILDRYSANGIGDPYVESLLFQLGRHFFISSSRDNSLPPNLAGRWSETLSAAWSADYHANINIQMNHWGMDATGLGDLQGPLWNYMEDTWVPRGTDTAKLLYGAPGWVVHNEMNIFGHTAMKDTAQWANYPASAAWMMQHVFDHFTYSQNITWLQEQGYPLIKGVAEFWLSQLQEDAFFNDGTLVVNPCNSPEHGPTVRTSLVSRNAILTFGCSDIRMHTLPTTPPPTLHLRPYPIISPPLPQHHSLLIPDNSPRSPRQRPAHLLLQHPKRMETPRHLRLRHPKRHTPPPLAPLRLVSRPQHLLSSLRLFQFHNPIRRYQFPTKPWTRRWAGR